ncbi:hypothetical protein RJ640_015381 [Escallonia rubra]|uniref:Transposase (putative) gypsy type domain-containing protein n=1 Tax=Escallonia rubra TaxID=112253 RepID=A0AA88RHS4_9ASTE|nr:hypothetical protein RJ640_015381 [Escallonia rubra]
MVAAGGERGDGGRSKGRDQVRVESREFSNGIILVIRIIILVVVIAIFTIIAIITITTTIITIIFITIVTAVSRIPIIILITVIAIPIITGIIIIFRIITPILATIVVARITIIPNVEVTESQGLTFIIISTTLISLNHVVEAYEQEQVDELLASHSDGNEAGESGEVKDQAEEKANPKPWYTADEKSSKMSTEDLQDLIREYPLPEGWYARLPGLGEPANYGTKFETGVYEEQVKSGYRLPLHPFALRFFEHYRMAPGQLVPNGWRRLAGLIYLVQTSGYKPDVTDFMRVFFEVCFVKGVANCPRWYYIHSRQRLLKGGPKSNKGWHSRYFFVGRLDKGELPFDKVWNPYCKDFENPGKPTPNSQTKHILSHIKLRGGLCIDEPLSDEQLEWAKMIPSKPIPAGLLILLLPAIPSVSSAETVPLGGFLGVLQKAKGKRNEKQPSVELPPVLKRTRVTPSERSPQILDQISIEDDLIFRPRWALRRDDLGMPDSQISEQHLRHGILP